MGDSKPCNRATTKARVWGRWDGGGALTLTLAHDPFHHFSQVVGTVCGVVLEVSPLSLREGVWAKWAKQVSVECPVAL